LIIGCLHLPNGNPVPGSQFDCKLAWFAALQAQAQTLLDSGAPVVLAGQLHWSEWHDYITVQHLADAIVDRLLNRAHKIDLRGESLRQLAVRPQT